MPSADPSPAGQPALGVPGPQRRAVLRAAMAGLASGSLLWTASACRLRVGSPGSAGPRTVGPTPPPAAGAAGPVALATAAGAAAALQLAYGQAIAVRPDLQSALTRLLDDHTAHLRALTALGVTFPDPTPTSTADSPPTSSPTPSPTPPPTSATALSVLGQLERDGVTSALVELAALDARTARLLASIAACRSSHLTLLARLPATPRQAGPPKATKKAGA